MKIVVVGGTGLIGTNLVPILRRRRHEVIVASPSAGVDAITGEGLAEAVAGAQVVVDVTNSPSFEDAAVMHFFQTASRNLLAAGRAARVQHHLALSIVGTDRLPESGYLRAKVAQEKLIEASGTPYSILRSTQFFEFGSAIADAATEGNVVRVPAAALIQPVFSQDVVSVLAELSLGSPVNGVLEVGGPERFLFEEFMARVLRVKEDKRKIIADRQAQYFGTHLGEDSLVTGQDARIGNTRYEAWAHRSAGSR